MYVGNQTVALRRFAPVEQNLGSLQLASAARVSEGHARLQVWTKI